MTHRTVFPAWKMAAAAAAIAAMASTVAFGVGDETVADILTKVRQYQEDHYSDFDAPAFQSFVENLIEDVPIGELTVTQIRQIAPLFLQNPAHAQAIKDRLQVLSADAGPDGTAAAILKLMVGLRDDSVRSEDLAGVLGRDDLAGALKSGRAIDLFMLLAYVPEEALNGNADGIVGLADHLPDTLPAPAMDALADYLTAVSRLGEAVDAGTKKAVHARVVQLYEHAIDKAKADGSLRDAAGLEHMLPYLKGAAFRGELIGHAAPRIDFQWTSAKEKIASLADLKGNVVVLDFWATWCGPCLASFPNLRELQEHYEGKDVVVLGVTSLQGTHYAQGAPPVDTKDDPAKEFELMGGFIKDMAMTWTVAFSEQDVFNPDFGVRGIPHMAIVDAQGVVRYNGLNAHGPIEEKTTLIDALLAESAKSREGVE